jgi:glycosyltransferase involved in cell wall biosynthesis
MHLSVVLPTYNRPDSLARCLRSLASQSADPSLWELVVVNDGGVDVNETVHANDPGVPVAIVNQGNTGPAGARNRGVENANGRLVAFIDDDCLAEPEWIEKMMAAAAPGELIGGKVTNLLSGNVCSEASQTLIDHLYESFEGTGDMFFTSNNICMHSDDFRRLGGFDSSFRTSAGEDREFCVRAAQAGIRLRHVPDVRIGHAHDLNPVTFLRMHFKYGRAASTYREAVERNRIGGGQTPSLGFYLSMLRRPFRKKLSKPLTQAVLLAASQVCTVSGFLYERFMGDGRSPKEGRRGPSVPMEV